MRKRIKLWVFSLVDFSETSLFLKRKLSVVHSFVFAVLCERRKLSLLLLCVCVRERWERMRKYQKWWSWISEELCMQLQVCFSSSLLSFFCCCFLTQLLPHSVHTHKHEKERRRELLLLFVIRKVPSNNEERGVFHRQRRDPVCPNSSVSADR